MHRILKAIICVVTVLCLLSFFVCATDTDDSGQEIKYSAYCNTAQEIMSAVINGADYISLSDKVSLTEAVSLAYGKATVIADADSIEKADEMYNSISSLKNTDSVIYRIKAGNKEAVEWAEAKGVKLLGYYKGNIYPIALLKVSGYGKEGCCDTVLLQTNNQDGVILHNSVTSFFDKYGVKGMFSFTDSTKSAKRTDTARSWDDLIARGYTVIETAYPEDFAIYLENNTAERAKLTQSINVAKATSTEGCPPNRVKDYTSALEAAEALINESTSATYAMADARAELDEAVRNIAVPDGSKIQGDVEITAGRVVAALFGIALVLSWQLFFRIRWEKKKEK